MRHSLTGQLLLLLAAYADYHRTIVSVPKAMSAMAGDPRFYHHRRSAQEFLRRRERLHKVAHELRRRGYVQEKIFSNTRGVVVTPKGQQKIFQLRLGDRKGRAKLPGSQWLMVFFDIPEQLKRQRDGLRSMLRELGFEQI